MASATRLIMIRWRGIHHGYIANQHYGQAVSNGMNAVKGGVKDVGGRLNAKVGYELADMIDTQAVKSPKARSIGRCL